jgi:hypothetical protein
MFACVFFLWLGTINPQHIKLTLQHKDAVATTITADIPKWFGSSDENSMPDINVITVYEYTDDCSVSFVVLRFRAGQSNEAKFTSFFKLERNDNNEWIVADQVAVNVSLTSRGRPTDFTCN